MRVNKMIFCNRTQADKFLKALLDYNVEGEGAEVVAADNGISDTYNDIHIYQEDSFIIIEWVQVPYDKSYGGEFKYVDEDQQVMLEVEFPDNSISWAFDEEDKEEMLNDWCKEHPTWKKNQWGMWYEEEKND